jgi:hypothetical protein
MLFWYFLLRGCKARPSPSLPRWTGLTSARSLEAMTGEPQAPRHLARKDNRSSEWVGRPGIEPGTYGLKERSSDSLAFLPAQTYPYPRLAALLSLVSQHCHWQNHWQPDHGRRP